MAECYAALTPVDPGNGQVPDQAQPHLRRWGQLQPLSTAFFSTGWCYFVSSDHKMIEIP